MMNVENGRPGAVHSGKPGSLFLVFPTLVIFLFIPDICYRASLTIAVIPDGSYRESILVAFRMDTRHKLRV